MKYLIIEDEQLAGLEMKRILLNIEPSAEILDILPSVSKSVEWINNNPQPDLIFMDIHLQDGICFDIFDNAEVKSPVIFTTAYDQYALQAFNSNGVAYLLKPIDEENVREALQRISNFSADRQRETVAKMIEGMLGRDSQEYIKRMSIKTGETYMTLPIENVAYFYSEDHYTYVCTKENKRYIINSALDDMETRLEPSRFYRATRNCIVSIEAVEKVNKFYSGRMRLHTKPEFNGDLYVSRNKVKEFIAWLGEC